MIRKRKTRESFEEAELNLVPFIDIFVTLISFLLVTAVALQLGNISVEVPGGRSEKSVVLDEAVSLAVDLESDQITLAGYRKNLEVAVKDIRRIFPLEKVDAFQSYLGEVKARYKNIHVSVFHASKNTSYQKAINVLNAIHKSGISSSVVLAVGVEGQ